jgi:hypothetical protein
MVDAFDRTVTGPFLRSYLRRSFGRSPCSTTQSRSLQGPGMTYIPESLRQAIIEHAQQKCEYYLIDE